MSKEKKPDKYGRDYPFLFDVQDTLIIIALSILLPNIWPPLNSLNWWQTWIVWGIIVWAVIRLGKLSDEIIHAFSSREPSWSDVIATIILIPYLVFRTFTHVILRLLFVYTPYFLWMIGKHMLFGNIVKLLMMIDWRWLNPISEWLFNRYMSILTPWEYAVLTSSVRNEAMKQGGNFTTYLTDNAAGLRYEEHYNAIRHDLRVYERDTWGYIVASLILYDYSLEQESERMQEYVRTKTFPKLTLKPHPDYEVPATPENYGLPTTEVEKSA